ncbi:DNA binding domain-containing protein, excisionase family [Paraburkholderia phenazinium]|uniref:DNA binding domain-containing protein, excisionase family n=1 Tax=Paraburkholderia phenazinium TaxID=60549 RepID=A0A1G7Y9R0_9BURK|nr:helix-turn-helix domain-containing protein [Paraburkholderia phenazinium]SDG93182.1 DNA binding domain-containing protein, excisionase family [Paraburkholderia phenazinium]
MTTAHPIAQTLLRTRDVAALLNWSRTHVRALAVSGRIPSTLDGQGRVFRSEDVSAYDAQRQQDDRDLMTLHEAAVLLGYANASSVTHLVERGVLVARPYRKAAKRVARADVEALLASRSGPVRRGPTPKR